MSSSTDDVVKLSPIELSTGETHPHHAFIHMKLGGRFSADIHAILLDFVAIRNEEISDKNCPKPEYTDQFVTHEDHIHREFALLRLRKGQVKDANNYIIAKSPASLTWFNQQVALNELNIAEAAPTSALPTIQIIRTSLSIDPELGRLACVLGEFNLFRAWAYAHKIDDGDGWVDRAEAELIWTETGIANNKRQARRLLSNGIIKEFWTVDKTTKRIYIAGQARLSACMTSRIIKHDLFKSFEAHRIGKWRVETDLSGSMQVAEARLYASWFEAKVENIYGSMISRETLCRLWQRSVPTLLAWEQLSGIAKQANYAQQNSIALDNVPKHAYLTLNRDGTLAAAWRLPNTYRPGLKAKINHRGKAQKIQKAVKVEVALARQRGSLGVAASPSFVKLYFDEKPASNESPFDTCEQQMRKFGKRDVDIHQPRYFYVGRRYKVRVFEPFDILSNKQETFISQRFIWQESQAKFAGLADNYRRTLAALP